MNWKPRIKPPAITIIDSLYLLASFARTGPCTNAISALITEKINTKLRRAPFKVNDSKDRECSIIDIEAQKYKEVNNQHKRDILKFEDLTKCYFTSCLNLIALFLFLPQYFSNSGGLRIFFNGTGPRIREQEKYNKGAYG